LVTGNNQKNTISEFKSSEYSSLKASLCTLYLHPTSSFLFYSIHQNGTCHYLKKIHWEENKEEIIEREFDTNAAFREVTCLSFPKNSTIIPNSFVSKRKEENKFYMSQGEVKDSVLTASLGANERVLFQQSSKWEGLFNSSFPECSHTASTAPMVKVLKSEKYCLIVATSEDKTQVTLKEKDQLLLSELYLTETATDSLFFVLSILKVHNIEDQSLCNIHLLCETNEGEMQSAFSDYFENIQLSSSNINSAFPLSHQDKIDFSVVLNAAKCAL